MMLVCKPQTVYILLRLFFFFFSDFTYSGPYNSVPMNSLAVNFSNAFAARYERYSILLHKVKPFLSTSFCPISHSILSIHT